MNDARGVGLAGLDARKTEVSMSILNSILEQVGGDATVQNLAAKVGLSPEKTAKRLVFALGVRAAHRTRVPNVTS